MSCTFRRNTHYRLETGPREEILIIPSRCNPVLAGLVAIFLLLWTAVGLGTHSPTDNSSGIFHALSVLAWGGFLIALAYGLAYMLAGSEVFRFEGEDLEVTRRVPGFAFRKLFRGADIRELTVIRRAFDLYGLRLPKSLFVRGPVGGIRFTYGMGTQDIASGMPEAEAAEIIVWLRKRLPEA